MRIKSTRLVVFACWAVAAATPSWAESLASSASSAGSQVSGSASDSLGASSRSSSPGTRTADGDYRVIEVAGLAARPDMLQLTLQATQGEAHEFTLKLPREALGRQGIAVGDVVQARNRPYGLEFARSTAGAQAREPFFLVLADDWHRELQPRAVAL